MEAYEERQQRAAETKEARQSYATNLLLDALNASDHEGSIWDDMHEVSPAVLARASQEEPCPRCHDRESIAAVHTCDPLNPFTCDGCAACKALNNL